MRQGDYTAARPLIETAHALNRDTQTTKLLFNVLVGYVAGYGNANPTPLERAQAVYYVLDIGSRWKYPFMSDEFDNKIWSYLNSPDSVETEEVKVFNMQIRSIYGKILDCSCTSKDAIHPLRWTSAVSKTPQEAMNRFRAIVSKLILSRKKISKEHRLELLRKCLALHDQCHILKSAHLDRKEVLNLWLSFLTELTKSDDSVVKIMAELGLSATFLSAREKEHYPQKKDDYYAQVMNTLIEGLNYPNEPLTLEGRYKLRSAVYFGIFWNFQYHIYPEIWIERIERLLNPLIDNSDAENLMLWHPPIFFAEFTFRKCELAIAPRILKILDGIIYVLEKNTDNYTRKTKSCPCSIETEISSLKTTRTRFLEMNPEAVPNAGVKSGLSISILCDIKKHMANMKLDKIWHMKMKQPTLEGEMLWIPLADFRCIKNKVGLAVVNIQHQSLHSLWCASLPAAASKTVPLYERQGITSPAVGADFTYLGVWEVGIVRFPGALTQGINYFKNPVIITEKDGLPSNRIAGIARVGRKLYVSVGCGQTASGFGIYDLKKKEWTTISSSRSKDMSCPLNNERPYEIISLTPTPDGKKLFFICKQDVRGKLNMKHDQANLSGLWKMDLKSGKIQRIWRTSRRCFDNIVHGEKTWWIRGQNILIAFDPDLEKGKIVVSRLGGLTLRLSGLNQENLDVSQLYSLKEITQNVLVDIDRSALFGNNFWVLTRKGGMMWGESTPWCIFTSQPISMAKKFSDDILGEGWIAGFFPTPYGVIVLGKYKAGLIK